MQKKSDGKELYETDNPEGCLGKKVTEVPKGRGISEESTGNSHPLAAKLWNQSQGCGRRRTKGLRPKDSGYEVYRELPLA